MKVIEGNIAAPEARIAIVVSRFNSFINLRYIRICKFLNLVLKIFDFIFGNIFLAIINERVLQKPFQYPILMLQIFNSIFQILMFLCRKY